MIHLLIVVLQHQHLICFSRSRHEIWGFFDRVLIIYSLIYGFLLRLILCLCSHQALYSFFKKKSSLYALLQCCWYIVTPILIKLSPDFSCTCSQHTSSWRFFFSRIVEINHQLIKNMISIVIFVHTWHHKYIHFLNQ